MKDKEVCQNWIKILGDVLFTIYMYLVAQTKVSTIQQRIGESWIFQSCATNKPILPLSLHKKAGSWKESSGRLPLPGINFKFEAIKNVLTQCLPCSPKWILKVPSIDTEPYSRYPPNTLTSTLTQQATQAVRTFSWEAGKQEKESAWLHRNSLTGARWS